MHADDPVNNTCRSDSTPDTIDSALPCPWPDTSPLATRWRTCLHEAGHAVAGRALLRRTTRALVYEDVWGLADADGGGVPKSEDAAVTVACGFVAVEELADKYAPPNCAPAPAPAITPEKMAFLRDGATTNMSDDQALAQWCIAGHEHRPIRWARRYDWVCQRAAELVAARAEEIVKFATVLFAAGTVTLPVETDTTEAAE